MTYYKDPLPWNLTDMSISTGIGRTYRYFTGTPLFEFGHGLSLTNFTLKCQQKSDGIAELRRCEKDGRVEYSCDVTNTGGIDGDEVVSSAPSSTIPSVSDSCADTPVLWRQVFLYHHPKSSPAALTAHAAAPDGWSLP